MIALARRIGIPCRYVSGYLSPSSDSHDRSAEGATHAWAEAYLPTLGWVGFDPTNDVLAAERHVRVAVGRDYADVPPTRGVFRGEAGSELAVLVTVSLVGFADAPGPRDADDDMGRAGSRRAADAARSATAAATTITLGAGASVQIGALACVFALR